MPLETPRFAEWLVAEKDAQAAEQAYRTLLVRSAQGKAVLLLPEKAEIARAARELANELFRQAMREMRELADSLSYRCRTFESHARELRATRFPWDP